MARILETESAGPGFERMNRGLKKEAEKRFRSGRDGSA
jgi:hypothetical protein